MLYLPFKYSIFICSCCIDYIAAAHVQGDAIVHFGPRCGSIALGSIPHLDIYDYHKLDSDALKEAVTSMFDNSMNISIILDNSYINLVGKDSSAHYY